MLIIKSLGTLIHPLGLFQIKKTNNTITKPVKINAPPASEKPEPKKETKTKEEKRWILFHEELRRDVIIANKRIKNMRGNVYGRIAERQ
jgi:hypothetical protein